MVKRLKSFRSVTSRGTVEQSALPRSSSQTVLLCLVGAFLVACALLGGDTPVRQIQFIVIAVAGTALLSGAVYLDQQRVLSRLPLSARLLILLFILLPWLQIIPLPPEIWRAVPGRELAADVIDSTGQSEIWRPITLDLAGTVQAGIAFLWLGGLLLAVLQLPEHLLRTLLKIIVVLGFLNILIGFFQFASNGAQLNFYDSAHEQFLLGFFSNKNHTALFLAMTILALGALRRRSGRRQAGNFVFYASLVLIAAALFATFSRAGLLLGGLAAGIATFLNLRRSEGRHRRVLALFAAASVGLAALMTLSSVAERSTDRFSSVGEDVRLAFWERSWPMVGEYFPVGGGLSTFSTLFRIDERLEWLGPFYLNHAHNDYIEFLIEAGFLGALLVGLAVFVLARSMRLAWLARETAEGRYALFGGAIVLLCALHSTVDYPLRRLAIAAPFILGYGIALRMQMRSRGNAEPQQSLHEVDPIQGKLVPGLVH